MTETTDRNSGETINHFDDLKAIGLRQPGAQRLLLVLLRAEPEGEATFHDGGEAISGAGTLQPVMATDRELDNDLRLDALIEEADQSGLTLDLIMLSSLSSPDGSLPDSEAAEPYLKQMADAVETGQDLSGYAVFDRAGCPVSLTTR